MCKIFKSLYQYYDSIGTYMCIAYDSYNIIYKVAIAGTENNKPLPVVYRHAVWPGSILVASQP